MRRKTDMCMRVVVDSNTFHLLTGGPKEDRRLLEWIAAGHGVLCQPLGGGFLEEIGMDRKFSRFVETLAKDGRARRPMDGDVKKATRVVADFRQRRELKSNGQDDHVLALVVADRAQVVVSDDAKFRKDVETISRGTDVSPLFYPTEEKGDPRQKRRRVGITLKTLRKNQLRFLESHKCRMR